MSEHSAAIDENGYLYTWGAYSAGQLGNNATENKNIPINLQAETFKTNRLYGIRFNKLFETDSYSYENNTIGKDVDGNIWTIYTDSGDRNDKYVEKEATIIEPNIKVDEEGKVWTKGSNTYGQLGLKNTYESTDFVNINELDESVLKNIVIDKISIGDSCAAVIDTEGKVWTWGTYIDSNNSGIPICMNDIEDSPIKNVKMVEVSSGINHVLALDEQGRVWSWGKSYLGNNTTQSSNIPICLSEIEDNPLYNLEIKYIFSSHEDTNMRAVIDSNGQLFTWGNSRFYGTPLIGNGQRSSIIPVNISSQFRGVKIVSAKISDYNGVALDENGELWTWGSNSNGGLGVGSSSGSTTTPVKLGQIKNNKIKDVVVTGESMAAIDVNGQIWTWGDGTNGQLGNDTTEWVYYKPIKTANNYINTTIVDISASDEKILAKDINGNIWYWGGGVSRPAMINVNIGDATIDKALIGGTTYTYMILDSNGQVWTKGRNVGEELGDNSILNSDDYVCLTDNEKSSIYGIKAIDATSGGDYNVMIDETGKVWIWGSLFSIPINNSYLSYNYQPICLDDYLPDDNQYKKILFANRTYILITDINDKLWMIGNSKINYITDKNVEYICFNDEYEEMKNAKFASYKAYEEYYGAVIETDGKLWLLGLGNNNEITLNNSKLKEPVCINNLIEESDTIFIDVNLKRKYVTALDSEGKIWTIYNNRIVCLTDTEKIKISDPAMPRWVTTI